MIAIRLASAGDVAEIVGSLLTHAYQLDPHMPELAARKRALADQLSNGLDQLPTPIHEGDSDGR